MKTYIQNTILPPTNNMLFCPANLKSKRPPNFPLYALKHTQDRWLRFQHKRFKLECKTGKGFQHSRLGTVYASRYHASFHFEQQMRSLFFLPLQKCCLQFPFIRWFSACPPTLLFPQCCSLEHRKHHSAWLCDKTTYSPVPNPGHLRPKQ